MIYKRMRRTIISARVWPALVMSKRKAGVMIPADGAWRGELRYTAYGEERSASGDTPTDYRYTGQRSQMETIGLYFYRARWYDPYLTLRDNKKMSFSLSGPSVGQ